VEKGYSQVECLDFDETFAPVARLESIRTLFAYATHHDFKLYQMDVKSVVDVSYEAPQAHGIVSVALHWEYSPGIIFIFSQGRKDLYHV
jgi:hypothetical protein